MSKVSIVTICLNEKEGIEKTLKSVAEQSYSGIQYIVIDGGSTDGTLDIISKYKTHIDVFWSGKDKGIYNAMNMGAAKADGDYLLFLNGGDMLHDDAVISDVFEGESAPESDIVYGFIKTSDDRIMKDLKDVNIREYIRQYSLPHPATFIRRRLFESMGGYDERFKIAGDYHFFVRSILGESASLQYLNRLVSVFDLNGISETQVDLRNEERDSVRLLAHELNPDGPMRRLFKLFKRILSLG